MFAAFGRVTPPVEMHLKEFESVAQSTAGDKWHSIRWKPNRQSVHH
jgi:hypothetical protein